MAINLFQGLINMLLINQMSKRYLFFTIFLIQMSSQTIINFNKTFEELIANTSSSANLPFIQALISIYQAHSELQNFTVVSIDRTSNQSLSMIDYFIQLELGDSIVEAKVSTSYLTNTPQSNFEVTIECILTNASSVKNSLQISSFQSLNNQTINNSNNQNLSLQTLNKDNISNPLIQLFKSMNISNPTLLTITNKFKKLSSSSQAGGYLFFTNFDDERYKIAIKYLSNNYHNLKNYKIGQVYIQIVSGVNFLVYYAGFDSFTSVIAKVNVDLINLPKLISFNVTCTFTNLNCSNSIAAASFKGVETLLRVHPTLLSYSLIFFETVKVYNASSLLFMVIFQNPSIKTQILSELMINQNSLTIQTFYTYLYPQ